MLTRCQLPHHPPSLPRPHRRQVANQRIPKPERHPDGDRRPSTLHQQHGHNAGQDRRSRRLDPGPARAQQPAARQRARQLPRRPPSQPQRRRPAATADRLHRPRKTPARRTTTGQHRIQRQPPASEMPADPLRQHPRSPQPITNHRRRQTKLRRDLPEINPPRGSDQRPADHLNRVKPPAQTDAQQQHMPRAATAAAPASRAQHTSSSPTPRSGSPPATRTGRGRA